MVMMNDCARGVLDPGDQAALLGHAARRWPRLVSWMPRCPPGPRRGCTAGPLRGQDQRRLAGGVVHVKLIELAGLAAGTGAPPRRLVPGLAGSVRCGCAAAIRWMRPWPRAGGSRWRASPEPASWPFCGLSAGAATRLARSACWTPPMPADMTGCRRRRTARGRGEPGHPARRPAQRPAAARAADSAGAARWPRARRRRFGLRLRSAPAR